MDNIEETIKEVVFNVVNENRGEAEKISQIEDYQNLNVDLGLPSLALARMVAILQIKLGVDPFAQQVSITDVRTVADLCNAYRKAISGAQNEEVKPAQTASADRGMVRAETRREAAKKRRKRAG